MHVQSSHLAMTFMFQWQQKLHNCDKSVLYYNLPRITLYAKLDFRLCVLLNVCLGWLVITAQMQGLSQSEWPLSTVMICQLHTVIPLIFFGLAITFLEIDWNFGRFCQHMCMVYEGDKSAHCRFFSPCTPTTSLISIIRTSESSHLWILYF